MTNHITIPESSTSACSTRTARSSASSAPAATASARSGSGSAGAVTRRVTVVDLRERSVTIKGQEILTADKAAIRISLLVYFKVIDAKAAMHRVTSYEERIYEDVQLAARRFLASRALGDILTDRNEISDAVREDVAGSAGWLRRRDPARGREGPGVPRQPPRDHEPGARGRASLRGAARPGTTRGRGHEDQGRRGRGQRSARSSSSSVSSSARASRPRPTSTAIDWRGRSRRRQGRAARPELLRLRELATLADMAKTGGKFVVGLPSSTLTKIASE
jgi:hypothetical protein